MEKAGIHGPEGRPPPRPVPAPRSTEPPPFAPRLDGGDGATEPVLVPAPAAAAQPAARPFRSMLAAEVGTASLLLALGGLVLVSSARMGIGWGSDGPESGFVPFWLAIVLVLCSASIVARALRRRSKERFATREQLVCVLKVLLPATTMVALTPFIGLYVASAIYAGANMRLVGRHSWVLSVVLPVALTLLVFLVFERWFLVPLPKGPIEASLGY